MNSKINEYILNLIKRYNLNSLDISDNPRELIIMVLSDILNCSMADIKLEKIEASATDLKKLENVIKKIAIEKVPPEYLTNTSYIYGNKFYVDNNTLVPRQDTETLIEESIKLVNENNYKSLLDLCTGTGIIGITIALNTAITQALLLDKSEKSLDVTRKNISSLDMSSKCKTICSDMFSKLYSFSNKYDIIVSNPPYLTKKEMGELSEFVKKEPYDALFGGIDGLRFYKLIYENARFFLNNGGTIAVEIGCMQAKDVINIISKYDEYKDIKVVKDINNKDRVVLCHFQKK